MTGVDHKINFTKSKLQYCLMRNAPNAAINTDANVIAAVSKYPRLTVMEEQITLLISLQN